MKTNQNFLLECKKCDTILCDIQEDIDLSTFQLFENVIKEDKESILCLNCSSFIGERINDSVKVYEKNVGKIFLKQNVIDFFLNETDEDNEIKDLYDEIEKLKKFCVFLYKNQSKKRIN